jgi:type II secretory pathway component GspD/PulD (secretin)
LLILSSKHGCFPGGGRVFLILLLVLLTPGFSQTQQKTTSSGERIVMCMIQLEHADAEELASVLEPLLSPEGRIVPYKPTNTLIIRDRASLVDKLSIAIKGKPCTRISNPSDVENGLQQQQFYLDR